MSLVYPKVIVALLACAWCWLGALPAWAQGNTPLDADPEFSQNLSLRNTPFWLRESAKRALESGSYDIAANLGARLLERAETLNEEERVEAITIMVDANLGLELYDEAEVQAERLPAGPSTDLRRALAAFGRGDSLEPFATLLYIGNESALTRTELVWLGVLRGWRATEEGERDKALEAFDAALELARLDAPSLAAQVSYIRLRARLLSNRRSSDSIEDLQRVFSNQEGKEVGYRLAQLLAIALNNAERQGEAIVVLASQIAAIPSEFVELKQELQLLQIAIAGFDRNEGRNEARALALAQDASEFGQLALQWAMAKCLEGDTAQMEFLDKLLEDIIEAKPDRPLLDEALYYRAVARLKSGDLEGVEDDADLLESKFADTPFRKGMLSVLAYMDWQRQNFRTAASHLSRLRGDYGAEYDLVGISSLIADCYFRAGMRDGSLEDFFNAAEGYEVALADTQPGELYDRTMYQLVAAYLGANQVQVAQRVLDAPGQGGQMGAAMRWRAEWSFARKLRDQEFYDQAYERVQSVLRQVDGELKLRFLWLSAKLSLETNHPDETENWLASLDDFISEQTPGFFEKSLLDEVRSSVLLTFAEAQFAVEEPEKAIAAIEKLRADYSQYEAALFSYFVQARYFSSKNRTVEAQQRLVYLADNYPESRLAPMALYEAALNAEKRGQDNFLEQANMLLERISRDYPGSDVVYYARLKQADLLRKLNQFATALQVYELLENRYRDRPDRYLAQISLADTLMARSIEDPAKFDAAISRFELLMDLPEIPVDLRVEAGYKLGMAWLNNDDQAKAKQAFWTLYDLVLGRRDMTGSLGVKGRYWLSRCLFALAELEEVEGDLDRAGDYYNVILASRLSGYERARAQLERIGQPGRN